MAERGRPGMSAEAKTQVWERVKAGESYTSFGRALGKPAGSIYSVVLTHGGIAPAVPNVRGARVDECRQRSDLAGHRRRGLAPSDRAKAGPRAFDDESRDYAKCESKSLSRLRGCCPCLAGGEAAHGLPLCRELRVVPRRRDAATRELVSRTNCGVAFDRILAGSADARSLTRQFFASFSFSHVWHCRASRCLYAYPPSKGANITGQTCGQIADAVSIDERPACIEAHSVPWNWRATSWLARRTRTLRRPWDGNHATGS